MSYDVFIASAPEDSEIAKLVTRRLRALKFKVRYSDKAEAPVFDSKDTRDVEKSQSMLVLWSEAAVKNDWVRAATAIANARGDMLIQARLDNTIPDEPFKAGKRHSLEGMTSRKLVDGFYDVVEELGTRDGRTDLKAYMGLKPSDDRDREAWLTDHPNDPITISERKKREKNLGSKPAPAKEAAAAAALMSATINGEKSSEPLTDTPKLTTPEPIDGVGANPTDKAALSTGPTVFQSIEEDPGVNLAPLLISGAAVIGMLLFALGNRVETLPPSDQVATSASQYLATCPSGTIPRSLLTSAEEGPEPTE